MNPKSPDKTLIQAFEIEDSTCILTFFLASDWLEKGAASRWNRGVTHSLGAEISFGLLHASSLYA